MKTRVCTMMFAAALLVASLAGTSDALAGGNHRAARRACQGWNGAYYHVMWGQPVALVVPPTAEYQTHWNWGVAQTAVTPIWPQFSRAYPGPYYGQSRLLPTPAWPSSTDQFGVYYVRGPW
ncbi:MAG TPA: hypothetical protein VFW87_09260 [Pirellulales bacterium]|nr:hypothetical protein [Pirellulales bacterium]